MADTETRKQIVFDFNADMKDLKMNAESINQVLKNIETDKRLFNTGSSHRYSCGSYLLREMF